MSQSFSRSLPVRYDKRSNAMVVRALGHQLNLKFLPKGVETEQQRVFLYENESDRMHGCHFSKPVSAGAIERVIVDAVAQSQELTVI